MQWQWRKLQQWRVKIWLKIWCSSWRLKYMTYSAIYVQQYDKALTIRKHWSISTTQSSNHHLDSGDRYAILSQGDTTKMYLLQAAGIAMRALEEMLCAVSKDPLMGDGGEIAHYHVGTLSSIPCTARSWHCLQVEQGVRPRDSHWFPSPLVVPLGPLCSSDRMCNCLQSQVKGFGNPGIRQ